MFCGLKNKDVPFLQGVIAGVARRLEERSIGKQQSFCRLPCPCSSQEGYAQRVVCWRGPQHKLWGNVRVRQEHWQILHQRPSSQCFYWSQLAKTKLDLDRVIFWQVLLVQVPTIGPCWCYIWNPYQIMCLYKFWFHFWMWLPPSVALFYNVTPNIKTRFIWIWFVSPLVYNSYVQAIACLNTRLDLPWALALTSCTDDVPTSHCCLVRNTVIFLWKKSNTDDPIEFWSRNWYNSPGRSNCEDADYSKSGN